MEPGFLRRGEKPKPPQVRWTWTAGKRLQTLGFYFILGSVMWPVVEFALTLYERNHRIGAYFGTALGGFLVILLGGFLRRRGKFS